MDEREIGKRLIEIGGGTPPQDDFMNIFKDIFYEPNSTRGNNQENCEGGDIFEEKKDSGSTH